MTVSDNTILVDLGGIRHQLLLIFSNHRENKRNCFYRLKDSHTNNHLWCWHMSKLKSTENACEYGHQRRYIVALNMILERPKNNLLSINLKQFLMNCRPAWIYFPFQLKSYHDFLFGFFLYFLQFPLWRLNEGTLHANLYPLNNDSTICFSSKYAFRIKRHARGTLFVHKNSQMTFSSPDFSAVKILQILHTT